MIYFNSQPHEEADRFQREWCETERYFNSQPHEEADGFASLSLNPYTISTHSLTRRLTNTFSKTTNIKLFQLTASRGGWQYTGLDSQLFVPFQLTASRGGWPLQRFASSMILSFQLTASRGGWRSLTCFTRKHHYFNSQPHEEADVQLSAILLVVRYFNSQPHEEADSVWI